MTSTQVVKMSVTNNSSFHNYPHPDDHTIRTTVTPVFKPFTKLKEHWLASWRASYHTFFLIWSKVLYIKHSLKMSFQMLIDDCTLQHFKITILLQKRDQCTHLTSSSIIVSNLSNLLIHGLKVDIVLAPYMFFTTATHVARAQTTITNVTQIDTEPG